MIYKVAVKTGQEGVQVCMYVCVYMCIEGMICRDKSLFDHTKKTLPIK
jgi:hypothetical protein